MWVLKRSPSSKYINIAISFSVLLVIIIIITSLTSWRNQIVEHGVRKQYYILQNNIHAGENISMGKLKPHNMFSKDAPKNAIRVDDLDKNKKIYAKVDVLKNSILLKNMVINTMDESLDGDKRIIFIPTDDKITGSLGRYCDIIANYPEGYGAEIIATDAQIIFDTNIKEDTKNSGASDIAGYFFKVNSDEALSISSALATGEIHLALKKYKSR